jgi:SlyX protein
VNEERLIDLETKVAYQEQAIGDLSDVIYRQQKQIDQLERLCNTLTDRVQEMAEAAGSDKGGYEKPPHY